MDAGKRTINGIFNGNRIRFFKELMFEVKNNEKDFWKIWNTLANLTNHIF